MRFLGIDYGAQRIGLALSDDTHTIAIPLRTLANDNRVLPEIAALLTEHEVEAIVLGASYDYQGADNPVMKDIQQFKAVLRETVSVPIHFESEMLTSQEAARHETKRELRDASAAALILQSFLDRMKNHEV